jgi:hypothetical protein
MTRFEQLSKKMANFHLITLATAAFHWDLMPKSGRAPQRQSAYLLRLATLAPESLPQLRRPDLVETPDLPHSDRLTELV